MRSPFITPANIL
jgi:hypothetical protein